MDQLGERDEGGTVSPSDRLSGGTQRRPIMVFPAGVRGASAGCGLERQRWQLDVAVLQRLLPAVLSLLLSRGLWEEDRPVRRLHQVSFV